MTLQLVLLFVEKETVIKQTVTGKAVMNLTGKYRSQTPLISLRANSELL